MVGFSIGSLWRSDDEALFRYPDEVGTRCPVGVELRPEFFGTPVYRIPSGTMIEFVFHD